MRAWKRIAEERGAELERARERIAELEDRLQASSLSEFRAHRPVAMPVVDSEGREEYGADPFGVAVDKLPELTPGELAEIERRKAEGDW